MALIEAASSCGSVFKIWTVEEAVHADQSVPSFTRISTDHTSLLLVADASSIEDENVDNTPFFNQRYSVCTMESISASENDDDAVSESDVVGLEGEIKMLSTVGAELED